MPLATHVVLISAGQMNGVDDIDAELAVSYEDALAYLRWRSQSWDWELNENHPLDRNTATLGQLNELWSENDDEYWVKIACLLDTGIEIEGAFARCRRLEQEEKEHLHK